MRGRQANSNFFKQAQGQQDAFGGGAIEVLAPPKKPGINYDYSTNNSAN